MMRRVLAALLLLLLGVLSGSLAHADSLVSALTINATNPLPSGSCLYVDQSATTDAKLCAGSPLGATLAGPLGALAISNNLSDLANAATARTNLGLAAVAASGLASDLSGILPAASLPSTGVAAGNCTNCNLTIDALGRVTAQGNGTGGTSWTVQATKSASYPLVGSDVGTIIPDSGLAITFTLPNNAGGSVFAVGRQFILQNTGSDVDTLTASTGTTITGIPTGAAGAQSFLPGNSAVLFTIDASGNYAGLFLGAPAPSVSMAAANFTLSVGSCMGVAYVYTGTTGITVTVPTGLFPGCHVEFIQGGSGAITLAAGSGFTLTSPDSFTHTAGHGATIGLAVISATTGVFQGNGA